jgi:hypothetical protein
MVESKSKAKSFSIDKRVVWDAWKQVRANQGAPGVDEESVAEFERDLSGNLYKLWNRMSSGTYMPPPVRAVQIPKKHGRGVRTLGVPTVADRVAQKVAALYLEPEVEPVFHPDSYGYRPKRSALDAVGVCRKRCWKMNWGKRRDKTVMRERMGTPNIKDLASHGGPESCVGVPRGRSEALTGVRAGQAIEPRKHSNWGADAVPAATPRATHRKGRTQEIPDSDGEGEETQEVAREAGSSRAP